MKQSIKQTLRMVCFPFIVMLVLSLSCRFLPDLALLDRLSQRFGPSDTPTPTEDFAQTETVAAITKQAQYDADLQATSEAVATEIEQAFQMEATAEALALEATQIAQTMMAAEATQNAQATLAAEATANAGKTATAQAREAAIQRYEFFDTFNNNNLNWPVGEEDNDYWRGEQRISNGIYTWQVDAMKSGSMISWANFGPLEDIRDFDVAFKARLVEGPVGDACYGIIFRSSVRGFSNGAYILTVCDRGDYKVNYYEAGVGWVDVLDWRKTGMMNKDDWNLVELEARGRNFKIFINHQHVASFSDSRLESGGIAIMMHIYIETPCVFAFDMFALQPR